MLLIACGDVPWISSTSLVGFFGTAFAAPIIALVCTWRLKRLNWFERIALGLVLGIIVAFVLCGLSLQILFRDGMGP